MRTLVRVSLVAMAACVAEPSSPPGDPRQVTFVDISSWPYTNGLDGIPGEVLALDATTVTMTGVAFPLDYEDQFFLVDPATPALQAPCQDGFTINSFVRVIPPAGIRIRAGHLVTCIGTFSVSPTVIESDIVDIYQLRAHECAPHKMPKNGARQ